MWIRARVVISVYGFMVTVGFCVHDRGSWGRVAVWCGVVWCCVVV